MLLTSLSNEDALVLSEAIEACLSHIPAETGFGNALEALIRTFFNTSLSRKAIYERLRRVKPLKAGVSLDDLRALETRRLLVVVRQRPLAAIPTPLGLYSLYFSRRPQERDHQLVTLLESLENESERKLRLTLRTFVETPLSDKEVAAVIFLLYNDSTAPARGRYPQTAEVRRCIDRIVQAFVKSTSEAEATPHADGAPGRWYMGEANRKLRNSINIQRGAYYIRPTHLSVVFEGLRKFADQEPVEIRRTRLEAFEEAFQRESSILARNSVLFATRESKSKVAEVLGL